MTSSEPQRETSDRASAPVPASSAADKRRWFALAIVMTAAFMDLVDVTIVNIAIPSIQREAGASFSQIQWITAGYALAFAAGLITGGRLGDIHGRKKLFLLGIGGFTVASALCGLAVNPEMLVASRLLQGAMAARMVPQVVSCVHATFPPHERGKVIGLFGAIVGLGWSALRAGLTGVPFSIAVSAAAGMSVQLLVPRFGRKVLQAGALVMAAGVLLYIWESERYGMDIASWQMALPLVVMGAGMGLIVAPLTDAVLSEVPREHAGSASGLINTVQQMGNALGLGLVSVVFFGVIDERLAPAEVGPAFADGFQHALGYVAAVLGVIFLLMFALPKRPAQHVEGAGEAPAVVEKERELVS